MRVFSAIFCYIGLLEHIFGYFLASAGQVSVSGFRGLSFLGPGVGQSFWVSGKWCLNS